MQVAVSRKVQVFVVDRTSWRVACSRVVRVTPNPVGTPLEIDTQFDPEAVIFLGPQPNYGNLFGNPWGGRCIGFLTEDFECCIAWGAYSHVGSAWSFCTSDYSWISNFTEAALSAPTTPNYGSAELDGAGIILTLIGYA